MSWKPDVCIYHAPCDDGFGAAWAVWRKWGDKVEYRPTNYGLAVPDQNIDGRTILVVDFSFPLPVLEQMARRAASIVVLDHHKSAAADLGSLYALPGVTAEDVERVLAKADYGHGVNLGANFDMEHSGARLTWNFCHPGEDAPKLIDYIEDRDLWRYRLPETRALSLYLRSFAYDFDQWTAVMERCEQCTDDVVAEAKAIERFYDLKVAEIVATATYKTSGGFEVPVAHAPYAFVSDVGHELLKQHPQAPFAAMVVDAYGSRTYSLRSDDSRQDVSIVAKSFGGGGHRNAAGFRVPA